MSPMNIINVTKGYAEAFAFLSPSVIFATGFTKPHETWKRRCRWYSSSPLTFYYHQIHKTNNTVYKTPFWLFKVLLRFFVDSSCVILLKQSTAGRECTCNTATVNLMAHLGPVTTYWQCRKMASLCDTAVYLFISTTCRTFALCCARLSWWWWWVVVLWWITYHDEFVVYFV